MSASEPKAALVVALPFLCLSLILHGLFYFANGANAGLVSAYPHSDAQYNFHKAWVMAYVDSGGGALGEVLPFSPYVSLLAFAFKVLGPEPWVAYLINALATCGALLLCVLSTYRLFGQKAAIFSGLLFSLCGVFIFFSSLAIKTSFVLFEVSLFIWLAIIFIQQRRLVYGLAALCICVFASFDRENIIILAFSLGVFASFQLRCRFLNPLIKTGVAGCLAIAFVLLARVSVLDFVGDSGLQNSIGVNFIYGNAPGANGGFMRSYDFEPDLIGSRLGALRYAEHLTGDADDLEKTYQQLYFQEFWEYYQTRPVEWLVLKLKHLSNLLTAHSLGHPEDYRIWRWHNPASALACIDWAVLLSLACVCLYLRFKEKRYSRCEQFLLLSALLYAVSVLIFFANERYRFPLYVMIMPFAAEGLRAILQYRRRAMFAAALVFALGFYLLPTFPEADDRDSLSKRREELSSKRQKHAELYRLYVDYSRGSATRETILPLAKALFRAKLFPDVLLICEKAAANPCTKIAERALSGSIWDGKNINIDVSEPLK